MNRSLSFLFWAAVLLIVVTGIYCAIGLRTSPEKEWEALLKKLITIDRDGVYKVALDAIEPSGQRRTDKLARELDAKEIWNLLGELDGLKTLELNSCVLVELATCLQRSHPEIARTTEDLRLLARELEWHVGRLRIAAQQGSLEFHVSTYAQNAAINYFLMEQRLHALCLKMNMQGFRTLHDIR